MPLPAAHRSFYISRVPFSIMFRLMPSWMVVSASLCPAASKRSFAASTSLRTPAKNRVYTSVRTPDEFHTLNLLSSSSNRPLITLWTSRTCSSCRVVAPLVQGLVENEGVGEEEGGLGFTEVEMDSTLLEDLPFKFMVGLAVLRLRLHASLPIHWSDQLRSDAVGFQSRRGANRHQSHQA